VVVFVAFAWLWLGEKPDLKDAIAFGLVILVTAWTGWVRWS